MRRISNKALLIIFAALLIASAVWILIAGSIKQDELLAEIYVEGRLVHTVDLSEVTESYTINLPHNTILVEPGQISMSSADCPDQLCVRQGVIKSGIYPIICLPNKVEVRIARESGIDAVTGGRS
ncbi:MAG: NusG domain II-containing protein [Clostridiales bacterium]|jgi:hypothetical protein|nr:NusG domain II-containing protein [Clostridiales bacterium]